MEAISEDSEYQRATHVTAEAVDAVTESMIHRSGNAFAESVHSFASSIIDRRVIDETSSFGDGRTDALHVAEVGFRNGRTAGLRARPGEDPDPNASIESAAMGTELNARQYSGHVPHAVEHSAVKRPAVQGLWDAYERSVSAGIRSVRRTPFGEDGPVAYDTADRGFDVDELLAERLQIQPQTDGRRAYDVSVPVSFVEAVSELSPEGVHVASHFVYSYADGALGVPLPYTVLGVELLRAYNSAHGTRYEEPPRVANLVRE